MYDIAEHRFSPNLNAVSCIISKSEWNFVELPRDLDLLQNVMSSSLTHAIPCHQVLGKFIC